METSGWHPFSSTNVCLTGTSASGVNISPCWRTKLWCHGYRLQAQAQRLPRALCYGQGGLQPHPSRRKPTGFVPMGSCDTFDLGCEVQACPLASLSCSPAFLSSLRDLWFWLWWGMGQQSRGTQHCHGMSSYIQALQSVPAFYWPFRKYNLQSSGAHYMATWLMIWRYFGLPLKQS